MVNFNKTKWNLKSTERNENTNALEYIWNEFKYFYEIRSCDNNILISKWQNPKQRQNTQPKQQKKRIQEDV